MKPYRLRELLVAARDRFAAAGIDSPAADARLLARTALERTDGGTFELTESVSADCAELLLAWVARRERREPLQLITGEAAFGPLSLRTAPGVFIPRPETELLALRAAAAAQAGPGQATVVDLGCGTGAIALFVAHAARGCRVFAVDVDPVAAELAESNARHLGLDVTVVCADGAQALPQLDGTCDVVVTNPPYIPDGAIPRDPEVHRWDPARALYGGGGDGLQVPRAFVARARALLQDGGSLLLEHGDLQAAAVCRLVEEVGGFTMVESNRDLAGRDRFVTAQRVRSALPREGLQ